MGGPPKPKVKKRKSKFQVWLEIRIEQCKSDIRTYETQPCPATAAPTDRIARLVRVRGQLSAFEEVLEKL